MSVFRVGSNKSSVNNFPSVRPTLDLDFANSKTLDPRITFTRASGGSYVGADGLIKYAGVNEARFDHNPSTGESLGLLVEESRSNLLAPSIPDNVSVSNATVVTNSIISPSGELNASFLREDTSINIEHYKDYGPTLTSGVTYTFSVFYKAGPGNRNFAMRVAGINVAAQIVNVTNNTITSGTIVDYGNDWYRAYYSFTATATGGTTVRFQLHNQYVYTGDGTSGIYIWGAQLEAGAFATSYIPTIGSTRTRAADNASITGKNFSEWYRQDEGTFYSQFKTQLNINNNIWSINNYPNTTFGTLQNYFRLLILSNNIHTQYNVAGTNLYPQFSLANNNSQKVTQSYNINSSPITSALNGTIGTGSGNIYATSPGLNQLEFGKNTDARTTIGQYTISRLTYFPKRLPNAQLQALTK